MNFSRRTFILTASAGTARLLLGKASPSNRITVGVIGIGRQTVQTNLPQFFSMPEVQVAALCERDELLDLGLDGLGLRLGRFDPLVLDDLLAQVHEQRLAVRGVAAELVPCLLMAHEQ